MRRAPVLLAALVAIAALVLGLPAPASSGVPAGDRLPERDLRAAAGVGVRAGSGSACPGYNGLISLNPASQVMAARFAIPQVPAETVGRGADIDWRLEREGNPSWHMWLHTMKWTGSLIKSYESSGDVGHLNRASAIARDWLADNDVRQPYRRDLLETVAGRTHTLLCLDRFVDARWLDQALLAHAEVLVGFYSGASNHGVDQSIAMLGVGCNLRRDDYVDLAISRMAAAAATMVDAEGATNEQAIGYAMYSYSRLTALESLIRECGRVPPDALQRVHLMPAFVAHAMRPDGEIVTLGDTVPQQGPSWAGTETEFVATQGRSGRRPEGRVAVYSAGYVFGRSGWGDSRPWRRETHYSLRHGPARHLHGHNDKQSLTFYARGREVLIDPGHNGYQASPYRSFLVSPEAHNVLTVRDVPFDEAATTTLTRAVPGPRADFFELTDTAYEGVSRTRRVLMLRNPDVALVLDTASSAVPRAVTQYWHLPADTTATVSGRGGATATGAGGERTVLLQVPLPGQVLPRGSTQVVRGQASPVQGWWSPEVYAQEPAPVVAMSRTGRSVALLTLVAPVGDGGEVSATTRVAGGATYIDLDVDGVRTTVRMGRDGMMSR